MKTVAVMQPTYLPWLGYFEMIRRVDTFVIYDTVQFEKQSWQQRNRIRDKSGVLLLTIPVKHDNGLARRIADVRIDHQSRPLRKHQASLRAAYGRAPNFASLMPKLQAIYDAQPERLMDLNLSLIELGMRELAIGTSLVFASALNPEGSRSAALIDICRKLEADCYLSPPGARDYLEEDGLFRNGDVQLKYHDYEPPLYRQMNHPDFISRLAFVDYLFNITL